MISHKYRCIFIHIPKCAGTSIEKAFEHFEEHHARGRQDHRSVRMIEKPFNPLKALKNKENLADTIRRFREYFRSSDNPNNSLQVNKDQYSNYFKFSFVRNPWDRAFSWYQNAMRDSVHQRNYGIPNDIQFEQFIYKFAGTGYLRPQTYWLENYDNELDFDFIGKFENLTKDFNFVCQQLNAPEKSLPHEIKSDKNSKTKRLISKDAVDFINEYYSKEIKLFDYDFAAHSQLLLE